MLLEVALAVGDLPDQGFTAGEIGVGLDPHAADGDPPPVRDAPRDAFEHRGVVLAHPLVLDGLGAPEPEVGVAVHEGEHVRERAGALADGLADRPEPGGVDVGVPDRGDPVGRRRRRLREDPRQLGSCRCSGAGNVVGEESVHHRFDGAEDLVASRLVERELQHEPVEGANVLDERNDVGVDHHELGPGQAVDRTGRGGQQVAVGIGTRVSDGGVGGRLDHVLHRFPTGRRRAHEHVAVEGMEAPHRRPRPIVGDLPEQALALEPRAVPEPQVDDGIDGATGPVLGDGARHPEPCRAPRPTEHRTDCERFVLLCRGHRSGHRLAGDLPGGDGERDPGTVDGRIEALERQPAKASFDDRSIVMHA